MKFSKQKMIDRIAGEDRMHLVDEEVMDLMNKLDGEEVREYCWRNVVMGENVGWIEKYKVHVNLEDCI